LKPQGSNVSAVNAAAKLSKLLQISGGAVYTDTKEVVEFDVSPRLNALMEVLEETIHKVIVFVPYTHTIELVSKHLSSQGVTNEVINGAVSARERSDIINRFQTQERSTSISYSTSSRIAWRDIDCRRHSCVLVSSHVSGNVLAVHCAY
jgi:superfamily II DNA/RNA helicase